MSERKLEGFTPPAWRVSDIARSLGGYGYKLGLERDWRYAEAARPPMLQASPAGRASA